jgi:outer membrane receptor protein involved in Fe transport
MSLRKATGLRTGLLLSLLALIAPWASAQTSMGGVSGTVTDSTGAVVPGATVTLTNEGTSVQAARQTNDHGYFAFVNVRPGRYTLRVELAGFSKAEVPTFTVGVNENVARNIALKVGAGSETVEVTAQSDLLQATTAELGNVVEEKVIRDVPLQGRNFTQLLLLSPGVNPVSTAQGPTRETAVNSIEGNSGIPGGFIANASIQGQQNRSKIYYMDGVVNTSVRSGSYVALPDIDSLQEFKVQTQSDKAEFGGVVGGVVNMTTKSGSNRFGGSVFGYFRNEHFAARNPFRDVDTSSGRPVAVSDPEFRQGQFGANIGGPIVKGKTFFFASYDGWRYRDQSDIRITVPTEAELNGDFSKTFSGRQLYNPFTTRTENGRLVRDPFPNNVIPANLISPSMQAFLRAYMVKPNVPGNVRDNFRELRDQENNSNAFQLRLDHHFSARDNVFVRWTERRINAFLPRGDLGFIEPDSVNRNIGGGWFHTFAPNMIVEVRGGVATQPTEDAPAQHPAGLEPQRGLGLPELDRFQGYIINGGSLTTPWTNMPNLGVQGPRPRNNPNWNLATDLTWLRGNHNLKLGFQMLRISRLQRNQFGQLDFSAEATRNPQSTANTGDPIASALLGLPSRIQGFVPDQGFIDFHTSTLSGYVQDQWQIKRNLTLNFGVRYDYVTRAIGHGDQSLQSGPDMDTGEWLIASEGVLPVCTPGSAPPCLPAPLGQIPFNQFITFTGERNSILKPITDNIGPRVGLAWQVNAKTVLRTGYALMWDSMVSRSQYGQHQFETWGWPQFSGVETGNINVEGGPITRIESIQSLPFLAPRPSPWNSAQFFNDPDRKNAYSHQWHLEVQREVSRNTMVGLAYVGSHNGRMEYAGKAAAAQRPGVDPATGRRLTAAEVNQLRPWPHITGTFTYSTDRGWANFNALEVKVQRRFASGIGSMLSYTWSRSKDTSSGWFGVENGIGGGAGVQNFFDIDSNYAVSSYDVPHIFTWATLLELPAGRGKRWLNDGAASWILGNWQLNWMVLARSGQPVNATVGGDPANIGVTGYARPNLVGDPTLDNPTVDRFYNVSAFAIPVNSFGDSPRNPLRAPSFWNVDLGLQKNVPIGRGRELQLRVEAFNVFNHINWAVENAAMAIDNAATAGRITSMFGRPRQLQFGLRLIY